MKDQEMPRAGKTPEKNSVEMKPLISFLPAEILY